MRRRLSKLIVNRDFSGTQIVSEKAFQDRAREFSTMYSLDSITPTKHFQTPKLVAPMTLGLQKKRVTPLLNRNVFLQLKNSFVKRVDFSKPNNMPKRKICLIAPMPLGNLVSNTESMHSSLNLKRS